MLTVILKNVVCFLLAALGIVGMSLGSIISVGIMADLAHRDPTALGEPTAAAIRQGLALGLTLLVGGFILFVAMINRMMANR